MDYKNKYEINYNLLNSLIYWFKNIDYFQENKELLEFNEPKYESTYIDKDIVITYDSWTISFHNYKSEVEMIIEYKDHLVCVLKNFRINKDNIFCDVNDYYIKSELNQGIFEKFIEDFNRRIKEMYVLNANYIEIYREKKKISLNEIVVEINNLYDE